MFSNKKPELHDIVFVKLKDTKTNDMGNYVDFVDYDNIEGLILCTEITKYNSNIKKIVKKDEIFPVIIIDIGDKNNYDLSYSKIKNDSRILLKECYEYSTKIYKLINKVSNNINLDSSTKDNLIKNNISNKIYENSINSKQNLYKILYETILINPSKIFENIDDKFDNKFDENIIDKFSKNIKDNLIIKPNIIHKEFKLLMFAENSLYKLKEMINKIKQSDIIVECKSSPIYYYKLNNVDMSNIDLIIEDIQQKVAPIISEYNCTYNLIDGYQIIKKGEIILDL